MQMLKNFCAFLRGDRRDRTSGQNAAWWGINIGALLVWAVGLSLVSLYFAAAPINHWTALLISYIKSPALLILNTLPVLLAAFFFWLVFNRVWIGVAGSGALVLMGSLINFYKITLRNDPFLAADVLLVSEAANMTGEYTLTLSAAVVLSVIASVAAVILSGKLLRARITKWPVRIALVLVIVLCGGLLLNNVYFDDTLYNKTENIDRNAWFLSRWSDRDQYVCRGFMYPFLHSVKTAVEKAPDGYDKNESAAYLGRFEDADIPEDKKVNVIGIMLEAYNDFSKFGVLELDNDPYEYMHKLQAEGISGELITNIFAGGTIDTERSFITGYPYMSEYRSELPTYVSYLKEQGYYAEGGHPGYDWFYNRRNVADWFGFDNYYFFEDRYAVEGDALMMDSPFFADLLSLYEEHTSASEDPYFSFSVTYQNHGPYSDQLLYDGEHIFAKDQGYSIEAYRILNNYLWGINKTDEAIEEMIESLREDEEPVVVVLFGDHNPWLGDNSFVYDELGISLDRGNEEGFYNYYNTPYVIWANDAAKAAAGNDFSGEGGDFSPNFLMNRVFAACGWEGPAYMQAANEVRETFDVVSRSGIVRTTDGVLHTWLEGELAEIYGDFKKLEYYMKHDYK
ncbi:MAG: LTA synthase family protein [Clostridia bacterium]|nr:LTA synthase family protein [Clostridia bacterium]